MLGALVAAAAFLLAVTRVEDPDTWTHLALGRLMIEMRGLPVREVLVFYLERRFCVRERMGTLQDRIARCRAKADFQLMRKRAKLQEMIESFRELSRLPETKPSALRLRELQIMNLDTDLFLAEKGYAETAAAIIYLYYRLSWNSVSIAEELGVKPPHIRQILYRLNRAYEKMQRLELRK